MIQRSRIFFSLFFPFLLLLGGCSSTPYELNDTPIKVTINEGESPDTDKKNALGIEPAPLVDFDDRIDPEIDWWTSLDPYQLGIYTRHTAHHFNLALALESVIVPLPRGLIVALDKNNGDTLWQYDANQDLSFGATNANNQIYVGTINGSVLALNALTGELLWEKQLTSSISSISAHDNYVYVKSIDGRLFKLDEISGAESWRIKDNIPNLSIIGSSKPLKVGDEIIYGNDSGLLIALRVTNGQIVNRISIGRRRGFSDLDAIVDAQTDLLYDKGVLYAASWGSHWIALDWDGRKTVKWERAESLIHPVKNNNRALIVVNDNGLISSVDKNTGQSIWDMTHLVNREPTSLQQQGRWWLTTDSEGIFHWFDGLDGTLAARYHSEAPLAMSSIVDSEGAVYYLNRLGHLVRMSLDDET